MIHIFAFGQTLISLSGTRLKIMQSTKVSRVCYIALLLCTFLHYSIAHMSTGLCQCIEAEGMRLICSILTVLALSCLVYSNVLCIIYLHKFICINLFA